MASGLTRFHEDIQGDIQDRIERLTGELASLRKAVSRRGGDVYASARDGAGDVYDDLWSHIHASMPDLHRGARRARAAARDNPVAAAVIAIGAIGLLATLLARRS
jgi:hypothetical protein